MHEIEKRRRTKNIFVRQYR